jgi:DnaJ-class molecular chaperone
MKDYYRILQVHPEAEKETITAAYRRLIRKYHPDTLPPEKRNDPDILQIVQDLNEAYEVLINEEKRLQYDETFRWQKTRYRSKFSSETKLERRVHLIRCGKTKRTFKMHLVRPQGSNKPFSVLGFDLLEDVPQITHSGTKQMGAWNWVVNRFSKGHEIKTKSNTKFNDFEDSETQKLFAESTTLTMGDIDWNGYACPDCGSTIKNANGTIATWSGCSTCGHIKCVGSVKETRRGKFSVCPWCGKKNKITRSVPLGTKDHLSLKGKIEAGIFVDVSSNNSLDKERDEKLESGKIVVKKL